MFSRFAPIFFVLAICLLFPAGSAVSLIAGTASIVMTVVTLAEDTDE